MSDAKTPKPELYFQAGKSTPVWHKLAAEIGLNESIVLQQIAHWIDISQHYHDDEWWTYQSVRDMQEKAFPYWSVATINRTIKSLQESKLIKVGNYNQRKGDKTRWFALNLAEINKLKSTKVGGSETPPTQNETPSAQNETPSAQNETTLPESTTESTTEKEKTLAVSLWEQYTGMVGSQDKIALDRMVAAYGDGQLCKAISDLRATGSKMTVANLANLLEGRPLRGNTSPTPPMVANDEATSDEPQISETERQEFFDSLEQLLQSKATSTGIYGKECKHVTDEQRRAI